MMSLREWSETYVRHRDLFERRITSIEQDGGEEEGRLLLHGKPERVCSYGPGLEGRLPANIIVVPNTRANVEYLAKHWQDFVIERLKIVFANVEANEKWVIMPASHHRVADDEALLQGLLALHQGVPHA